MDIPPFPNTRRLISAMRSSPLTLCLLSALVAGCDSHSVKPSNPATPTAQAAPVAESVPMEDADAQIGAFETPAYLPALGEETTKQATGHAKLPPPPVPTSQELAEIASSMTPDPAGVGTPADNREVWDALARQPQASSLILRAEQALDTPIPPLTQEMWQLFEKKGDRRTYQDASCERYNRLADLALGEALEYRGRFLPAIVESLTAILDQGTWSVPAHGKALEVYEGKKQVVDLAAAQLSWTLATVDYWLADKLPVELRTRLRAEIERRVLHPYLNAIRKGQPYWWMGTGNNWTAVCCGAVTGAALTLEPDPMVRAEFIADARLILRRYIDSFSDEGVSEEGVGYWFYGFSHYLYASEAIRRSTQGAIDLLADEKVLRISQSPRSLEIADGVYGAFGDQSVYGSPDKLITDFAAMRYGLPGEYPAHLGQIDRGMRHPLGPQLYSLIIRPFGLDTPPVKDFKAQALHTDDSALRNWFPLSELFICRPGDSASDAMSVAIRAGNNGEYHNHNDIGSYVVVYKGIPVLLDPGMERYTFKSFGPERYESQMNNSFGHPVPLVGNRMQKTGAEADGKVLSAEAGGPADTIVIDLTQAYRSPGLKQLTRTLRYERPSGDMPGKILISDHVEFSQPEDFSTALVTHGRFEILDKSTVKVTHRGVPLYISVDTGGIPFAFAESPVTGFVNPNKAKAKRLGIYLIPPTQAAKITATISPVPPPNNTNPQ